MAKRRQLSGDVGLKTSNAELVAAQKHIREQEMENAFLKKLQPSSRKGTRNHALLADEHGEGKLSHQVDG